MFSSSENSFNKKKEKNMTELKAQSAGESWHGKALEASTGGESRGGISSTAD